MHRSGHQRRHHYQNQRPATTRSWPHKALRSIKSIQDCPNWDKTGGNSRRTARPTRSVNGPSWTCFVRIITSVGNYSGKGNVNVITDWGLDWRVWVVITNADGHHDSGVHGTVTSASAGTLHIKPNCSCHWLDYTNLHWRIPGMSDYTDKCRSNTDIDSSADRRSARPSANHCKCQW